MNLGVMLLFGVGALCFCFAAISCVFSLEGKGSFSDL